MQKLPVSKYSLMRDGITQSLFQNYMACPKKFSLVTAGVGKPTKMVMELGSAGHKALETLGKEKYIVDKSISKEEQLQIEACVKAIYPAYAAHYAKEDAGWKNNPEMVFDALLEGTRIRGKIDNVLHGKNSVMLRETKFKARISEDSLDRGLALDFQSLFYVLAYWLQTGVRPSGVQYDVVRYPTIKFGMTPKDIYDAVILGTKKEPERWFYRWETAFTEQDILTFKGELVQKLKELRERKIWYRNECACNGAFKCDFIDYCAAGNLTGLVKRELFSELNK